MYFSIMVFSEYQKRQWQPTPVLLPGKSHGWRSLVGCSAWGRKESDTTERLDFHFSLSCIGVGNGNPLQFLAWGIPYREEPCGLQFIDLQKLDMTYATDHEEPRPRGATPRPRSGVVDKTSYPTPEVRAVDDRSYHTSKEWRLHGCRKA